MTSPSWNIIGQNTCQSNGLTNGALPINMGGKGGCVSSVAMEMVGVRVLLHHTLDWKIIKRSVPKDVSEESAIMRMNRSNCYKWWNVGKFLHWFLCLSVLILSSVWQTLCFLLQWCVLVSRAKRIISRIGCVNIILSKHNISSESVNSTLNN